MVLVLFLLCVVFLLNRPQRHIPEKCPDFPKGCSTFPTLYVLPGSFLPVEEDDRVLAFECRGLQVARSTTALDG